MKIDLNKKYRYRDGTLARIICVDAGPEYPVVSVDPRGEVFVHTANGKHIDNDRENAGDLIEVREPLECRIWVAADNVMGSHIYPADYKRDGFRLFREVIE